MMGYTSITDFAKDTFILFLREFYSTHDTYTYLEDETKTKIQICDSFTFNLEVQGFRPGLSIRRGSIKFQNATLGQTRHVNFQTGKISYTDLMSCGIMIECVARNGLEAERIATTTFNAIHMTREAIQEEYKIFKINSVDLGVEQPYKQDVSPDLIMVPVSVSLLKQVSWSSTPIAPKVAKIITDISTK